MKYRIYLFYVLICLFFCSVSHAQTASAIIDSLTKKIDLYGKSRTSSVLFAHFDKDIYLVNENVWFTAYLLNYNAVENNPSILSVLLVNNNDSSVAVEQKFIMAKGLSFGNVFLADSIPPGDYTFILYTNVIADGKPVDVFTHPVSIRSTIAPPVRVTLSLQDTARPAQAAYLKVLLSAKSADNKPLANAKVNYQAGTGAAKVVKTDKDGSYLLSIPSSEVAAGNNLLKVAVGYDNTPAKFFLKLPADNKNMSVKFYPEGGSLVHATRSTIGWEAKDANRRAVKTKALLLAGNHVIDTIETDIYGMGRFSLIPMLGTNYHVKLIGAGDSSAYSLPAMIAAGPVITIQNAIANDTLHIRLVSKYPSRYVLIVHDYRTVFAVIPVYVNAAGLRTAVILKNIPKELATITVLDSLQRPCAERIFFAHFDQHTSVNMTTDKPNYGPREKVHLTLNLNVDDSAQGIVSVACVQTNRLYPNHANDMESYVSLENELAIFNVKEKCMSYSDENIAYLNNLLLIKGWRRYKWQDINKANDTPAKLTRLRVEGEVLDHGKLLKKPISLMIKSDSLTTVNTTDKFGNFTLDDYSIITEQNKKVKLIAANSSLSIILGDSFSRINKDLIKAVSYSSNTALNPANIQDTQVKLMQRVIQLKTVTIKGSRNNEWSAAGAHSNACGDYVCIYNILNCPNHRDDSRNRAPVKGELYFIPAADVNNTTMLMQAMPYANAGTSKIMYTGCTIDDGSPTGLSINGLNYSKEFYGSDYAKFNPPEPEYISTLYWNHLCFVNSAKRTDLSFYTGDIIGSFKIIVQGITSNGVTYGEKEFYVEKP